MCIRDRSDPCALAEGQSRTNSVFSTPQLSPFQSEPTHTKSRAYGTPGWLWFQFTRQDSGLPESGAAMAVAIKCRMTRAASAPKTAILAILISSNRCLVNSRMTKQKLTYTYIHFRTQSDYPIRCYRKPAELTNEIKWYAISLVRSFSSLSRTKAKQS